MVHTVNYHRGSNGYIFTVVFKTGEREEIKQRVFSRGRFWDDIQYDRLRDELGRLIFVDYDHQELNEENNENP